VFLGGTAIESLRIQQQLKTRNILNTRYTGSEGNEESFKQLDGAKTALIHLATHGFFLEDVERKPDDREPVQRMGGGGQQKAVENPLLRSGLILAGGNHAWSGTPVEGVEDGILTADEIARLNLTGTRLVVLSACQTGLGDVNNGEGVFGLQRAFKLAGVETLIMSLWDVSDSATSELMTVFYEQWLSGRSKQEAFKEAQRRVREKYPAPFFWAAFVLMD
jgi:CHAT domain-containing protein